MVDGLVDPEGMHRSQNFLALSFLGRLRNQNPFFPSCFSRFFTRRSELKVALRCAPDDERIALGNPDGVLVHQVVELAGDCAEVEGCHGLPQAVGPDLLQGRYNGGDVRAWSQETLRQMCRIAWARKGGLRTLQELLLECTPVFSSPILDHFG